MEKKLRAAAPIQLLPKDPRRELNRSRPVHIDDSRFHSGVRNPTLHTTVSPADALKNSGARQDFLHCSLLRLQDYHIPTRWTTITICSLRVEYFKSLQNYLHMDHLLRGVSARRSPSATSAPDSLVRLARSQASANQRRCHRTGCCFAF